MRLLIVLLVFFVAGLNAKASHANLHPCLVIADTTTSAKTNISTPEIHVSSNDKKFTRRYQNFFRIFWVTVIGFAYAIRTMYNPGIFVGVGFGALGLIGFVSGAAIAYTITDLIVQKWRKQRNLVRRLEELENQRANQK